MNPNAQNATPQTVGFKISQAGFDATTCPDYDLIFNSSWPSLSIAFDKTLTVSVDSFGTVTPASVAHNLGFYPLAMEWVFTDTTATVFTGRQFPSIDKNNIYLQVQSAYWGQTVTINVKAYNLDISKPQNYTYIQAPINNLPYDKNFGIKVAKATENIGSNDLRSFILHSRAASPQVLAVVTEKSIQTNSAGAPYIQYQNPQNYTGWAFGYAAFETNGNITYIWAAPNNQAYPRIFFNTAYDSNSNKVTKQGNVLLPLSNSGNAILQGSIIVLRDPLFVANTVEVHY